MADAEDEVGRPVLDLDLSGYTIERASVRATRAGAQYNLTFGPVSNSELTTLQDAARLATRLRLDINSYPVVIDLSATERAGPASVRLSGRIVSAEVVGRKG